MRWLKMGCLTLGAVLMAFVAVAILAPSLFRPPEQEVRLEGGVVVRVTDTQTFTSPLGRRVFAVTYAPDAYDRATLEARAAGLFARYRTEAEAAGAEEVTVVASGAREASGAPGRSEPVMTRFVRGADGRWGAGTQEGR